MSRWIIVGSVASLALAACGSDEPADTAATSVADGETSAAPVSNACPVEGCMITIVDAVAEGDEIAVTWETNFVPDVSKNHIHIYWDIYTADQVTADAEARGEQQGEWVPTADVPTYVTESAVSVSERGDSTTLCATAGDRDHIVIDSSIVSCFDVSDLLS
ncbi:MAG: hypothetical protein OEV60_09580 [Actinomycetota bacterium]|nr:hypothetical protein [Actinomycetota bacterium]MDH5223694.1 hypothetical protein [Actinomycetota bacterium]MDH5313360.1 hypothetical protein [Actinomycetota bacterium]